MIKMSVAVIGLILFFVLEGNNSKYVNEIIEDGMLLSMIVASFWVYFSLYKLDVNPHPISFLDDLLLLICLPAFFLFCVLGAIAGMEGYDKSYISTNLLTVRLNSKTFHIKKYREFSYNVVLL